MDSPMAVAPLPGLSPRLALVARLVMPGAAMADIGTDHGYLPAVLTGNGFVPRAVAADRRAGPLAAARRTIAAAGLAERVDLRLGDGLAVLTPGEVGTVVMAGMGGALMVRLLTAQPAVVRNLRRLVLQPNTGAEGLRRWLAGHGWRLVAEDLVAEGGRIYVVLAAAPEPGFQPVSTLTDMDHVLGPCLQGRRDDLYRAYVHELLTAARRIAAGVNRARIPHLDRAAVIAARVARLEAVLAELGRSEPS